MTKKVGLIGYALTGFGDNVKHRSDELVFSATRSALDVAGISHRDIDTTVISSLDAYDGITISNGLTATAGAGYEKDATRIQGGGVAAMLSAFASIQSDSAEIAVVAGADATIYSDPEVSNVAYDIYFRRSVGMFNLPSYALVSTALMKDYKANEADFALAAAKNYKAAADNPNAHRTEGYTAEQVMASPFSFWPLRELEVSPISRGAAALILASEEKTRELTDDPIWVTGIGAGSNAYFGSWQDLVDLKGLRRACRQAYEMSGIKDPAAEIDAAELHNPFSPFEIPALEALGLCEQGHSLQMLRDGSTSLGGAKPVNASGGTLGTNPPGCGGIFRAIQAAIHLQKNKNARRIVVQDSDINLGFFGETYHVAVVERGGIQV